MEAYIKSSLELFKLQSIDKIADMASSLISRMIVWLFVSLIIVIIHIGVAFWLGDILGKNYWGFFAVAGFDIIVVIILYLARHRLLKLPINHYFIKQFLKK